MAAPAKITLKKVKPILSLNQVEAHRRVISLYKAWYRQIPYITLEYDIPKTEAQCLQKLREEFRRHNDVKDVRIIDILVIKGQIELEEISKRWKTIGGIMNYWKETWEPKPKDFMSKFLSGQD